MERCVHNHRLHENSCCLRLFTTLTKQVPFKLLQTKRKNKNTFFYSAAAVACVVCVCVFVCCAVLLPHGQTSVWLRSRCLLLFFVAACCILDCSSSRTAAPPVALHHSWCGARMLPHARLNPALTQQHSAGRLCGCHVRWQLLCANWLKNKTTALAWRHLKSVPVCPSLHPVCIQPASSQSQWGPVRTQWVPVCTHSVTVSIQSVPVYPDRYQLVPVCTHLLLPPAGWDTQIHVNWCCKNKKNTRPTHGFVEICFGFVVCPPTK